MITKNSKLYKFARWLNRYKVWFLLAPLYASTGLVLYWTVMDRNPPLTMLNVDYTPHYFYETQKERVLNITYTLIRQKPCMSSIDRYLVSVENPNDLHYIGSVPRRDVSDYIGEVIDISFEIEIPNSLLPGMYNYYTISNYSCSGNPFQYIIPVAVKGPVIPIEIKAIPKIIH